MPSLFFTTNGCCQEPILLRNFKVILLLRLASSVNLVFLLITNKHQTRLERFARDKHSNLLRKSVNYGGKMFYRIAQPGGDLVFLFITNNKLECLSVSVTVQLVKLYQVSSELTLVEPPTVIHSLVNPAQTPLLMTFRQNTLAYSTGA